MPSLSNLQSWMRGVLTHPAGVGAALESSNAYLHVIGETRAVSRERRLSIYANGYFGRIIEALGANYSSVKNAIGEDRFDPLAHSYLVKHPSTFKSIDDVGHLLSDFLKKHPLAKKFPFLPDLARIEWAAHQAFYADDHPPLDPQRFQKDPEAAWQNARFTLDPSVRLLAVQWPVDQLWRDDGQWTQSRLARIKKARLHVLVFRQPDKWVRLPRITADQFALLSELRGGKTLGQALLRLSQHRRGKTGRLPVQDWFREWIQDGVFQKIEF
jgi:hypothetical protein